MDEWWKKMLKELARQLVKTSGIFWQRGKIHAEKKVNLLRRGAKEKHNAQTGSNSTITPWRHGNKKGKQDRKDDVQ